MMNLTKWYTGRNTQCLMQFHYKIKKLSLDCKINRTHTPSTILNFRCTISFLHSLKKLQYDKKCQQSIVNTRLKVQHSKYSNYQEKFKVQNILCICTNTTVLYLHASFSFHKFHFTFLHRIYSITMRLENRINKKRSKVSLGQINGKQAERTRVKQNGTKNDEMRQNKK